MFTIKISINQISGRGDALTQTQFGWDTVYFSRESEYSNLFLNIDPAIVCVFDFVLITSHQKSKKLLPSNIILSYNYYRTMCVYRQRKTDRPDANPKHTQHKIGRAHV